MKHFLRANCLFPKQLAVPVLLTKRQFCGCEQKPKHLNTWFDFHRYVYLKSELLRTYEESATDTEMISILEGHRGKYSEIGKSWDISEFQSF